MNKTKLCGGNLLSLLVAAGLPKISARQRLNYEHDSIYEYTIFNYLIKNYAENYAYIVNDVTMHNNAKSVASKYKGLAINPIFFKDELLINNYRNKIETNYSVALNEIHEMIVNCIDSTNKGKQLINGILKLIELDNSINEEFIIDNNIKIQKKDLLLVKEINLEKLILSVWSYIVINKITNIHKNEYRVNCDEIFLFDFSIIPLEYTSEEIKNNPSLHAEITAKLSNIQEKETSSNFLVVEHNSYFQNILEAYIELRTILYSQSPKSFYDIYVCNNLCQSSKTPRNTYNIKTFSDITSKSLSEISKYIIISGTGGLGKSMMMRHLLLNCINNYNQDRIFPIYVELKDFDVGELDLLDFIYNKYNTFDKDRDILEFENLLERGHCMILFDGLDEINPIARFTFEKYLEDFINLYKNNFFVISSRPDSRLGALSRFSILDLRPFTKEQAILLIEKLEFRPKEPSIKETFLIKLKNELWYTHTEFIENPLLLTLMLMTFDEFKRVSKTMSVFYKEAFETLAYKHDSTKPHYERKFKTGLTTHEFSLYLSEFCAVTYFYEENGIEKTKLSFEDDEFFRIVENLNIYKSKPINVEDFLYDLSSNMCILYKEGRKYYFIHRSFQEYFTAEFFKKQLKETYELIGELFEHKNNGYTNDKAFNMLFEMESTKVLNYILLPFLQKSLDKWEKDNGYKSYLQEQYPTIYYDDGDVTESEDNIPSSFLLNFIITNYNLSNKENLNILPFDDYYIDKTYYFVYSGQTDQGNDLYDIKSEDEIEKEANLGLIPPDLEEAGHNLSIDTKELLHSERNEHLEIIESPSFPLFIEYNNIKNFYIDENKKIKKVDRKNPFNSFIS